MEAALAARKADAEQWAAAAAQAQAAAAVKDGELAAQRTQLEALQGDLAVEQRRLQEGLARADLVRAVHAAGGQVAASMLRGHGGGRVVGVCDSRLSWRTCGWVAQDANAFDVLLLSTQHHSRSPRYSCS